MLLLAEQHGRKVHELLTSRRCILVELPCCQGKELERKNRLHSISDDKMEDEEVFLRDPEGTKA